MKLKNETDQVLTLIRVTFRKVFAFKFVYLASFVLFIVSAYLYNKYSIKVYELYTTIGPVKDARSSMLVSNDMNRGSSSGRIIEEAINNLYSFNLIYKAINSLNLEVGYYVDSSRIYKQFIDIYPLSPFTVNIDKSHLQAINTQFYITILSDSTFRLKASEEKPILFHYFDNEETSADQIVNIDTIFKFNETIKKENFKFTIYPNKEFLHNTSTYRKLYCFELYNPEKLAKAYLKALTIRPVSYMAAIIKVQFAGANLKKSLYFINNYVNLFLEENLAKKNKIALSTINFIDSQISEMSDSLITSESELSSFRSNNQVMDLSYQGRQIYGQMAALEADRAKLERQIRYYNYILNYFRTSQDISGITSPSSADFTDPIISDLISTLNELVAERSTISKTNKENVFYTQVENKIKIQKQVIIDHVNNSLNTSNITLNDINNRAEKLRRDISRLPRQEMNMFNIQRKYNFNNEQYSYLLQKRSEASITLASTYPDFEVLEPAREITSKKIKPKGKMTYLLSLFLGGLIPSMFLIIKGLLDNKISSPDNLEHLINRPVFSIIFNNPSKSEIVVTESPRSSISESFRNLRSSLFYKLKSRQSKVILVTSSQPQDGKSFISYNLATSIASTGIKTILIDCDLRKPKQHLNFKDDNSYGVSNFLMKNTIEDKIIHNTSVDNLFFIPAGPIVQNPSELIATAALDDLINFLILRFEYIIIDTPPIGIVADTIQLMKYATLVLIVARNNVTKKDIIENALAILDLNNIVNYEVILNDQDLKGSPYRSYKGYYHKG
jgi:tyrosine-protein kinase Etk/Wzc